MMKEEKKVSIWSIDMSHKERGQWGKGSRVHRYLITRCEAEQDDCTHLKVANLHGSRTAQNVRSCPHQPRSLDLSPSLDDLRLSGPLALRRHTERILEFLREHDIFY